MCYGYLFFHSFIKIFEIIYTKLLCENAGILKLMKQHTFILQKWCFCSFGLDIFAIIAFYTPARAESSAERIMPKGCLSVESSDQRTIDHNYLIGS